MSERGYNHAIFGDGFTMPNSLVVFHLGQVYELLKDWDGKGMLFFFLDMARSGYSNLEAFRKFDVSSFHEAFEGAGLLKSPSKGDFRLVETFERILLAVDQQNDLYSKLKQNILHQKKVSFKLTLYLSQINFETRRIMWVYKDGTTVELDKSIVDYINSLKPD